MVRTIGGMTHRRAGASRLDTSSGSSVDLTLRFARPSWPTHNEEREAPATAPPGRLNPFDPAKAHDQAAHSGGSGIEDTALGQTGRTPAKQIAGVDAGRQASTLFVG